MRQQGKGVSVIGKLKGRRVLSTGASSAAGLFGCAGMSAYSATKGAMHAYTQALRVEAMEQGVHVCEVLPISVRTPFFDNAKTGTYRPTGIVLTPETVARSIVRCLAS